jgi:hypothetical protein
MTIPMSLYGTLESGKTTKEVEVVFETGEDCNICLRFGSNRLTIDFGDLISLTETLHKIREIEREYKERIGR